LTWFAQNQIGVAKGVFSLVDGGAIIAKERRLVGENIQLIDSSPI
jgi:hypothetical protein